MNKKSKCFITSLEFFLEISMARGRSSLLKVCIASSTISKNKMKNQT